MKKEWMALAVSSMLLGCTTPTSVPHDEADSVSIKGKSLVAKAIGTATCFTQMIP